MVKVTVRTINVRGADYWQARYTEPWSGKTKSKGLGSVIHVSEPEARQMADELAAEIEEAAGGPEIDTKTVGAWTLRYLELRAASGRSEATLYQDRLAMESFRDFLGPSMAMAAIRYRHCDDWRAMLSETKKGLTVAHMVRRVRSSLSEAVRRELIEHNPMREVRVHAPKAEHEPPDLSHLDVMAVIYAHDDALARHFTALCALAGLKTVEASSLRWGDVKWAKGSVEVASVSGHASTRTKPRTVRLEPELVGLLRPFEGDGGELVCGPVKNRRSVLMRACRAVGVEPWPRPWHGLKGWRENAWLEAGWPPQDVFSWMGHSALVAAKHYLRASKRNLEQYE